MINTLLSRCGRSISAALVLLVAAQFSNAAALAAQQPQLAAPQQLQPFTTIAYSSSNDGLPQAPEPAQQPAAQQPAAQQQPATQPQPATPQQPATEPQPATQQPDGQHPATQQPDSQQQGDQSSPGFATRSQDDQQPQQNNKPVGTAVGPVTRPSGVAGSRPSGAVIAPSKQRRVKALFIRYGLIAAAIGAAGAVYGLSSASPSRPQ